MKKEYSILIFCLLLSTSLLAQSATDVSFLKQEVKNFHQVDSQIFRSAQPDKADFKLMDSLGIKEVLNFRQLHKDNKKAASTDIKLHYLKLRAGKLTEQDLFNALAVIKNRKGPILFHCWHGSDRTGAVAAMYEIVFINKDVEAAIKDMIEGGYGFHRQFDNIPQLIRSIDIAAFKAKLEKM